MNKFITRKRIDKKISAFPIFFAFKLLINAKKNVIIIEYKQEVLPLSKKEPKQEKIKSDKKQSELVTKESICAVCALFSLVVLLILFTRSLIFGSIGVWVHSVLLGAFGYMAYPLFLTVLYVSVTSLIGVGFIKDKKLFALISTLVVCLILIIHIATTYSWSLTGYISKCFTSAEVFPGATVCGFFGGIVAYLLSSLLTKVGAIVILSALTVFCGYTIYRKYKGKKLHLFEKRSTEPTEGQATATPTEIPLYQPTQTPSPAPVFAQPTERNYTEVGVEKQPAVQLSDEPIPTAQPTAFSPFGTAETMRTEEEQPGINNAREFLFGGTPAENYRRNLIFDPTARVNQRSGALPEQKPTETFTPSYTSAYEQAVNNDELTRPNKIYTDYSAETKREESLYTLDEPKDTTPSFTPIDRVEETPVKEEPVAMPKEEERFGTPMREEESGYKRHDYMDLFSTANPNLFGREIEEDDEKESVDESRERVVEDDSFSRSRREDTVELGRGRDIFDDDDDEEDDDAYMLRTEAEERRSFDRDTPRTFDTGDREAPRSFETSERETSRVFEQPARVVEPPKPVAPPEPPKPRIIRPYVRVPLDDFDCRDVEPTSNLMEVEETKANILATLDEFKISGASIASVTFGPTVTRYNVTIPRNISPRKVVALDQSIAISLHSAGVNIYPNYEDGVVSIEVPNKDRQFVQLGCMLTGDTFVNAKPSSLMFTMGKDVGNRKVYGDISKMIHLLVAGSSGSGKSVFLGSLIISLIYKYSPEELRLILIDPKKTEFVLYNDLPHLMINEIITDVHKAIQSLNWAIGEMNRRYTLFEQMSRSGTYVVNLDQYNTHVDKSEKLPKIVIIIDELADLMLASKKDVEDRIQNLTQKARAAGIHLIVATQRPSIDVITGVIKSNLATRIAFAVATDVDSRVILDQSGAQKLLGKGDFLYTMQGINTPVRVQSAFISPEDSQRVVNFIKANNEAYYDEEATAYINNTRGTGDDGSIVGGSGDEVEAVYIEALRFVILSGSASISMIQRKCSVGYNKAGKIVEWMEDMGYISAFDGAKARKVLISKEEFESKYGAL